MEVSGSSERAAAGTRVETSQRSRRVRWPGAVIFGGALVLYAAIAVGLYELIVALF